MTETILYTGIIQNILDITKYHYGFKIDQRSLHIPGLWSMCAILSEGS